MAAARELAAGLVLVAACGGGAPKSAYAPEPPGCPVVVFDAAPDVATANIGTVVAWCTDTDRREACLRELEDQVCLLGGDVLWQIEGPTPQATSDGMKQRMRGRAARRK